MWLLKMVWLTTNIFSSWLLCGGSIFFEHCSEILVRDLHQQVVALGEAAWDRLHFPVVTARGVRGGRQTHLQSVSTLLHFTNLSNWQFYIMTKKLIFVWNGPKESRWAQKGRKWSKTLGLTILVTGLEDLALKARNKPKIGIDPYFWQTPSNIMLSVVYRQLSIESISNAPVILTKHW